MNGDLSNLLNVATYTNHLYSSFFFTFDIYFLIIMLLLTVYTKNIVNLDSQTITHVSCQTQENLLKLHDYIVFYDFFLLLNCGMVIN